MVHLLKLDKLPPGLDSQRGTMAPVKLEVEDSLEDQYGPFHKRSKLSSSLQQQNWGNGGFPVPPSQYNPLDEPSPLGLRLRKSPSLLDLIQMRLSQTNGTKIGTPVEIENKGSATSGTSDKLKASNFPASILKIGTWEYKSRYEGDLVAKCYFAKHKLVWEVLDGGLKNKIEIQWSDIMALQANYPEDRPGSLDVVLARQPIFFRETNPQPRKHTLWQATSDFTGGQASIHRRHYLQCPKGLLGKHFEKLIQCDPRLNCLSQQAETSLDSPYFEPRISVFDDLHEVNDEFDVDTRKNPTFANLREATSTSGAQSSSSRNDIQASGPTEENIRETPSPSSVMDAHTIEEIRSSELEQFERFGGWEQTNVRGFHHSMSMSDLVNHLENWITEQKSSNNAVLSNDEKESLEVLEDIRRCLFSDSQQMSASDEKSLMSRVNSLCCLLQKDPALVENLPTRTDSDQDIALAGKRTVEPNIGFTTVGERKSEEDGMGPKAESSDLSGSNQAAAMSRKDSLGELLLSLPRIASLPYFLFNISEDSE